MPAPRPLSDQDQLEAFDCGVGSLNDWLRRRARANEKSSASRTFVVCSDGGDVVAYHCLSACTVSHHIATSAIRRNIPDPVPMMLLGRLAVDLSWSGRRLGSSLLKDAVLRTARVAEDVGVRGLLVHAISEDAKRFYRRYDFVESPADAMSLMVRLADIAMTVRNIA